MLQFKPKNISSSHSVLFLSNLRPAFLLLMPLPPADAPKNRTSAHTKGLITSH